MRPLSSCLLALAISVATAGALLAQHETAADIEDGGRVFRSTCANCHGPDGNDVAGIDLGRGQFRRPMTDQDLKQIIRNGIPGTSMPGSSFSDEQAARVVAYLRSIAAAKGNPAAMGVADRGKAVFDGKGSCAGCHRVNGAGSRLGPDLSDIGQLRRITEIEASLLEPDAEVLHTNRSYRVLTKDGVAVSGRLLNLDTFSVQMIDTREQLRSFEKSALKEFAFVDKTPMPSFKERLSAQEIADVVSYLVSLKGKANP